MAVNDNSTMLDTTLFTDTEDFIKAGVYFENLFKSEGLIQNRSKKRRKHLQLILANLLRAHHDGKDAVSFSRNRSDYSPPFRRSKWKTCAERYSPFGASHDPLIHAIDNMVKLGLVDGRKGYRQKMFEGIYDSSWSRMFATDKLLDLIEKDLPEIDPDTIGYSQDKETVILRDQDKTQVDYEDTGQTVKMRQTLRALNGLLNQTTLDISDAGTDDIDHAEKLNRPYNKFLYRIFNNGSFERGGRFYGGYWISGLPKGLRPRITINGKKTAILDFETMSMNLLYNHAGLKCQSGASPTWWSTGRPKEDWPELQKIHKKLMTFALNTDSLEAWVKVAKGYFSKKRYPKRGPITDMELQEFLYKFHEPVKDLLFNPDLGLQLIYTESKVTEGIVKTFIGRDIPILPFHDGFICPEEHEEDLRDTMISTYTSVTGKEPSGVNKEA